MELYDSCIREMIDCIGEKRICASKADKASWDAAAGAEMVFRSDMALELGGSNADSASGIFYTNDKSAAAEDEICVIGKDIPDLIAAADGGHSGSRFGGGIRNGRLRFGRKNSGIETEGQPSVPFGRIVLIRINEEKITDKSRLYQLLRAVEFGRYHVHPKGCMIQVSALEQKESIRVSKDAAAAGVTLAGIGKLMLGAYHKIPQVEAVKILFLTDPEIDYARLREIAEKSENITKALDHLTGKMIEDCSTCGLKNICDEVKDVIEEEFPENKES